MFIIYFYDDIVNLITGTNNPDSAPVQRPTSRETVEVS